MRPRAGVTEWSPMKRKKIIIITDSVSMPRPGIPYEDTWVYMIKKEFPEHDFIDRTGRGSTSTRLVTEGYGGADLLETYMPDIVVLQIGMAECAPRLFDKKGLEFRIVSSLLPVGMRRRYIALVKKHRDRDPRVTDVTPEQFRKNITSYFERARYIPARVIVIPILPPTREFLSKSPRALENVDRYNQIFHDTARIFPHVEIVDPFRNGIDINDISVDEFHVGARGSKIIFKALKPLI